MDGVDSDQQDVDAAKMQRQIVKFKIIAQLKADLLEQLVKHDGCGCCDAENAPLDFVHVP